MGSLRSLPLVLLVACGPSEIVTPMQAPGGEGESFESPFGVERVQLSQTEDVTIAPQLSLACSDANGTKENSWYRMWPLRDTAIDKPLTIYRVNFGVQTAIGDGRVKVSVGTYAGAAGSVELDPAQIDVVGLTTIPVFDGHSQMLQANFPGITIPVGANLVVEIKTEGYTDGRYFYLGSTQSAETIPGYLRAPGCNRPNPVMTSALGYSQTHLIISVSGAY